MNSHFLCSFNILSHISNLLSALNVLRHWRTSIGIQQLSNRTLKTLGSHLTKSKWWLDLGLMRLTLDEQVAGGADSSHLICGSTGKTSTIFSKSLTDQQLCKSMLIAGLEIDRAFNLVVLSEPHDDRCGLSADLALQGHRLAFRHICVL